MKGLVGYLRRHYSTQILADDCLTWSEQLTIVVRMEVEKLTVAANVEQQIRDGLKHGFAPCQGVVTFFLGPLMLASVSVTHYVFIIGT